mmetsp:Transcript_37045/g.88484  ORF Transcript_37045/g.88484 Transcript_37045/m.88484 type:complete len:315 (+) Transcript_37045:134-1078(+)|eukprot:CAMPEP_0181461442 /NCGR_PEP_ID=MMETSP1110-20121109/33882_1 /TAXON_ID=174948 /ORGANISM="Symbiodinium sp., Strain CCMP421" /LENGTH=314 /DNA_ID=CAMNT_0023586071 /DNA_START=113 /DNA_END=1057 /DNA_ORIENTATION=+
MEGLASGVSVALDFVSLSALVMVRCYIAQCCRALTASEAKREFKAVGYWVERFVMVLIAFQVYALCIDAWSSAASKPILFLFKCGLASSSVGLCFALRACSTCSLVPFLAPSDTVLCPPSAAKGTEQDVDDEFAKDDSSDGPSTADGGDDSDLSDDSMDDDLHDCNDLNLDNKEQDEPLCEANTSLVMPSVKELPPRCPIALIDGNVHLRMLRSQKKQRLACINEEFRADKPKWLAYLGKLVANELLPRVPVGVKAHSWDNAVEALKQLHEWMQSDDAEHLRQAYKPCLGFRCDCCGSAVRPDEQVCAVCGSLA